MTRKQIERRVRSWQERLGLGSWDIVVDWSGPPPSDGLNEGERVIAEISAQETPYDRAIIAFASEVTEWPDDGWGFNPPGNFDPDEVIVHELLHAAMRDLDREVELLRGNIHRDAFDIFIDGHHERRERFVDNMARAVIRIHRER